MMATRSVEGAIADLVLVGIVLVLPVAVFLLCKPKPRGLKLLPVTDSVSFYSINDHETKFLYKEIYEDGAYEDGSELEDGDVVVDVGANIGVFSAWAAERVGPSGRVFSFEVIPRTFAALQRNAAYHSSLSTNGTIVPRNVGIGAEVARVPFSVREGLTIWSSQGGEGFMKQREEGLVEGVSRSVEQKSGALGSWVAWALGPSLLRALVGFGVNLLGGEHTTVDCDLEPLGVALRASGLERGTEIALLKIDVEGAEVAVLQGISSADWTRVRRVAIEVEDADRVSRCRRILEANGFDVSVSENPAVDAKQLGMHSELAMVYGVRKATSTSSTRKSRASSRGRRG